MRWPGHLIWHRRSPLLRSAPTTTHLFSDNEKVRKALEVAEKHRPYTLRPYVPTVAAAANHGERALQGRHLPIKGRKRSSVKTRGQVQKGRKPQRPSYFTAEEKRPQAMRLRVVPLGEVREVVPGLVSLSQMPCPFPPFVLPLPPAVGRVGGCFKDFAPFWRKSLDCTPFILEAVNGFRPPIHFPPTPFPAGAQI
jgi:hypothetical protein